MDDSDEQVVIQHNWHELRLMMWDYVGIVRTSKRLARANAAASTCSSRRCRKYYANFRVSNNLLELRNLLQVAELHRQLCPGAQGVPQVALQPRLPRHASKPLPTVLTLDRGGMTPTTVNQMTPPGGVSCYASESGGVGQGESGWRGPGAR